MEKESQGIFNMFFWFVSAVFFGIFESHRFPDARPNVTEDIGLTKSDFKQISTAYNNNMDALR
jgi:hypothetical protein